MIRKLCVFFILGIVTAFQIILFLSYSKIFIFRDTTLDQENTTACNCSESNPTFSPDSPDNNQPPTIIYTQEDLRMLLNKSEEDKKVFPPKSEFDFLLRLRKLILYSVREVNLRIAGQECTHWWANPRTVSEVKQVTISEDVTQYSVTFEIQPGRIPFFTVVNVSSGWSRGGDFRYEPEELVFVEGGRLDISASLQLRSCGTVPSSLHKICLCPEEKVKAEEETKKARKEWEVDDPELNSWPPNLSMLVPDYITFGRMDYYLNSPTGRAEFCGPDIKMILFVSMYPDNFEGRKIIRELYGSPQFLREKRVKVLFVFDRVTDERLQDKIDDETEIYDDILQGSHAHSYHNLTIRDLSMFNWIVTHCRLKGSPMPQWFMKTDDDYFINIPLALEVAAANPHIEVMGVQNCGQPVVRDPAGQTEHKTPKYYTPKYIHGPEFYAGYLSGASWLIRSDVLPFLLKASLTVPFIPADDVYIMGMLAREVGIRPRDLTQMTYDRRAGPCQTKQTLNSKTVNHADMYVQWEYLLQPKPSDCVLPSRQLLKAVKLTDQNKRACFFY